MAFLPKDYKIPTQSRYMKFKEGANRFRILADAIIGTEYWIEEEDDEGKQVRKPIRVKPNTSIPVKDITLNKFGNPSINHFWMFPVYNYESQKVQLLEITQKKIMEAITALINNPKWGDPKEYDIVVTRNEGEKVTYLTNPDPKEKIEKFILEEYKSVPINLDAIWEGKDPFKDTAMPLKGTEDVNPKDIPL